MILTHRYCMLMAALVVAAVLGGCTRTAEPEPEIYPTRGVENYFRDTLELWCEVWFDCPGGPFYFGTDERFFVNTFGSKEACIAAVPQVAGMFGEAESIAAVKAGRLAFDPDEAARCLENTRRQECGDEFELDACDNVFEGFVDDGDPCAVHDECESAYCEPVPGTCYGICGFDTCLGKVCDDDEFCHIDDGCKPRAPIGEACTSDGCVAGADCLTVDAGLLATGVCVAEGSLEVGQTCSAFRLCQSGVCGREDVCLDAAPYNQRCTGADCGADLVCNLAAAEPTCIWPESLRDGDPCDPAADYCGIGLSCDPGAGQCAVIRRPDGTPCDVAQECESDLCTSQYEDGVCAPWNSVPEGGHCGRDDACESGLWCDTFDTATCRKLPGVGERCNDGTRPFLPAFPCLPGLACLDLDDVKSGLCGPLREGGEPCQNWSQCAAPNTCIEGTCSERKDAGARCETAFECQSYRCDGASHTCHATGLCELP